LLLTAGALVYLTPRPPTPGTVRILVRDGPIGWLHVNVTFGEVDIHPANDTNDSGWISLPINAGSIDFVELGNLTKLLSLERVAPGEYTQIRIQVATASGVTSAGMHVNMTIPDQGILKTTTPFDLSPGGTTSITLDFDLGNSIHSVGGKWIFTPVLGSIEIA
jgi:Domain of unknown function (DUF4382)